MLKLLASTKRVSAETSAFFPTLVILLELAAPCIPHCTTTIFNLCNAPLTNKLNNTIAAVSLSSYVADIQHSLPPRWVLLGQNNSCHYLMEIPACHQDIITNNLQSQLNHDMQPPITINRLDRIRQWLLVHTPACAPYHHHED